MKDSCHGRRNAEIADDGAQDATFQRIAVPLTPLARGIDHPSHEGKDVARGGLGLG